MNAIVKVTNGTPDHNSQVEVLWEGKTVMMFTQDLRDRAELIDGADTGR